MDQNSDDEERTLVFRARLTNPNILACGLRGIANGKRDQLVQVSIVPDDGIHFLTTDSTKALQGCASISDRHFEEWMVADAESEISFRVNLAILLDCLTMLGTGGTAANAGLLLEYAEGSAALSLQLIEVGATTECLIRIISEDYDDDEPLDFAKAFRAASSINKAIVLSDQLRDAFVELSDVQGAGAVRITVGPTAPMLRLSTDGDAGVCYIDFGSEFFSSFEATSALDFSYRLNLLQRASKPLTEAEKTFLRLNSDGILSFQHLIRQTEGQRTYVEFYVVSTDESAAGLEEPEE